jgi:S1-C subfamily serine protease
MRNRTPWFLVGFLTCALVFGTPSQAATATIASLTKQVTKLQTSITSMKARLGSVESLASLTDDELQVQQVLLEGLTTQQQEQRADVAALRTYAIALDASNQSVKATVDSVKATVGAIETTDQFVHRVLGLVEPAMYQVDCTTLVGTAFGIDVTLSDSAKAQGYVGAVITNYHVVSSCLTSTGLTVTQNKRNLGARLWSVDTTNDLALILTTSPVTTLSPRLTAPQRGERVLAVGSPYGLEGSVTLGIISQLDADTVITDAAVDPGNSGGALVDGQGRLVGINTWGWVGSQGSNHALKPGLVCRKILICTPGSDYLAWSS